MIKTRARVLYISYNGAMEPISESQVVPYMVGLARNGFEFKFISFEKKSDIADTSKLDALKRRLADESIEWIPLKYNRSFLLTAIDIVKGFFAASGVIKKNRIDFIHSRSYVSAMIAWLVKKVHGTRFIFDMRGMLADEYADGGLIKKGAVAYKITKYFEKSLLLSADKVIVLTSKIADEIKRFDYLKNKKIDITVIPCCVDLDRFRPIEGESPVAKKYNLNGRFVLAYVGSLGTWYLLDKMVEFFIAIKKSGNFENPYFMILTQTDNKPVLEKLKTSGINEDEFMVSYANSDVIPEYLAAANAGILFYKPAFSRLATSPVKMGEYLASGLPLIANSGIGDVSDLIESQRVGVVISEFSGFDYKKAADELSSLLKDGELKDRCRLTARKFLSLDTGVSRYREVYERLIAQ